MASARKDIVLDTSVWIAILHEGDSQHKQAKKLLATHTEPVVVPEYVLLEVVTVLRNLKRYKEAERFMEQVLDDSGTFLPADGLAYEVARVLPSAPKKLSFVDVALTVLAKDYKVVTLDKVLKRVIESGVKQ